MRFSNYGEGGMEEKKVLLVQEGMHWASMQSLAQNAVVQVFAQVGRFNWLEPYKIEDQYENRGTGFFIDDEGYFITNAHVVSEAKRLWIHVPALGKHPLNVEIVGFCPDRDLALLRLQPDAFEIMQKTLGGIAYFSLGDSDHIKRTESILALGYPLGQYRLKSATGVISGVESIVGRLLIQITAPVNPGNSGGPLLNVQGEVIGVAIASVMMAQNVGYAIPINELRIILDDLYQKKLVRKILLGVRFTYSGDQKAQFFSNPIPAGLYISAVLKGSLFEKAGVLVGDMLYEFNGFRLDAYGEVGVAWSLDKMPLHHLVGRIKEGQKVSVVIYRNGKKHDIEFIFAMTPPTAIRVMYPGYELIDHETIAGLAIMPLVDNHIPLLSEIAPDLLHYRWPEYKVDPVLIITHILPGSYAHQLGILVPGDIIVEVNGLSVNSLENFRQALQKSVTTGMLTVRTNHNAFVVFSIKRLLIDEKILSQDFVYPISKMVQQLYNLVVQGEK